MYPRLLWVFYTLCASLFTDLWFLNVKLFECDLCVCSCLNNICSADRHIVLIICCSTFKLFPVFGTIPSKQGSNTADSHVRAL